MLFETISALCGLSLSSSKQTTGRLSHHERRKLWDYCAIDHTNVSTRSTYAKKRYYKQGTRSPSVYRLKDNVVALPALSFASQKHSPPSALGDTSANRRSRIAGGSSFAFR
ncbi:hypothetical protein GY45DRAFT_1177602 [Cubamyces sp. BRFM 1775]|nr:hypothetical protein GY45DRAFT_1177602 [Cubamyces sp. BRFM 1775]